MLDFEYFTWVAFFRFKKDLCYNTIYTFFLHRAKKAVELPSQSHYVEHRLVRTDLTTGEVQLDEHAVARLNTV